MGRVVYFLFPFLFISISFFLFLFHHISFALSFVFFFVFALGDTMRGGFYSAGKSTGLIDGIYNCFLFFGLFFVLGFVIFAHLLNVFLRTLCRLLILFFVLSMYLFL